MITVDVETTGVNPRYNCMVSLGAVDFVTGKEFYGKCRIHPGSLVDPVALTINGFTEQEINDPTLPLPHELFEQFYIWQKQFPDKLLAGHNFGHLDMLFLEECFSASILSVWPFGYRTLDLHSVAFAKWGQSLSHDAICDKLGLPREPKPHNALDGARSEHQAFLRLL